MKSLLKIFGITGVVIFLIYNVIWTYYTFSIYEPLKERIGVSMYSDGNSLHEDGYTYGVKAPNYLVFTGNLSVSKDISVGEDGRATEGMDLIISPLLNGEYEYELDIHYSDYDNANQGNLEKSVIIRVDRRGKPLKRDGEQELEILRTRLKDVEKIFQLAREKWNDGKHDL